jgi:hypothetical protein
MPNYILYAIVQCVIALSTYIIATHGYDTWRFWPHIGIIALMLRNTYFLLKVYVYKGKPELHAYTERGKTYVVEVTLLGQILSITKLTQWFGDLIIDHYPNFLIKVYKVIQNKP